MVMDKKQLQQLLVIIPMIFIAGVFGYYKYLLAPLSEKKKAVAQEMETIKKEYDESLSRASRLPKLKEEIVQLNLEITKIQKRLPLNKDIPYLIRMLSEKMERYNIRWTKLSPGPKNQKTHYVENIYTIPFKCSYHDLAMFLADIGQMERIFSARFTKLATQTDPKLGILVSGELTFLIYTSQ